MIIRIVKMIFHPEKIVEFEKLFDQRRDRIRSMPGCNHLELLQDNERKDLFFTYSFWENAAALEQYRQSAFFKETWKSTKVLFAEKAEAWSVTQKHVLK